MEQAILKFFESIRCAPLTVVFGFFSAFGETAVVAAFIILTYWLADRRTGEQAIAAALTSIPVNVALKLTVRRPRPYIAGKVSLLEVNGPLLSTTTESLGADLSFPSGHAQMTSNFLTSASLRAKRAWVWIASAAFVLLVICSRMYFGVHYPTDLLAGLALGVAVALFWQLVYARFYGARYFILSAIAILLLVPALFFGHKDYEQAAGLLSAAALFLPICDMVGGKDVPFPKKLWRIPLGLAVTGAVFALTLLFPKAEGFSLLKWFLIALAAGLSPALFRTVKV